MAGADFAIPPGDANYPGLTVAQFDRPVTLNLLSRTCICAYFEQKPIEVPKGTKIELFAHWDNSANNKYNPDPKATIRWGDQSWDEMLFVWVGVVVPRDTDPEAVMAKPASIAAAATPAADARERVEIAGIP